MSDNATGGMGRFTVGEEYFVECFDCHRTWCLDTATSGGDGTFDRCSFCGSFNTMRYDDDCSIDTGTEQ